MHQRRIIIVDDHPLFRAALRLTLGAGTAPMDVTEATNLDDLTGLLERDRDFDAVLLDLNMPGVRGFSGLLLVRAQFPDVPVIVVSAQEDPLVVRRCLDLGAAGYMGKSMDAAALRAAIETVLAGDIWTPADLPPAEDDEDGAFLARLATLTPQQLRVLMMLGDGLMNKQIAYELSISEATVKAHVSAILQKLRVDSRTQAVIAASKFELSQFAGESAD